MLSPEGRVIMVSGANRGIGLAVASCLHDKGYRLSLGGRDAGKLAAARGKVSLRTILEERAEMADRPRKRPDYSDLDGLRARRRRVGNRQGQRQQASERASHRYRHQPHPMSLVGSR